MSNKKVSLLWSIEHPNFKAPCYLFGTMHVKDDRAFNGIESIKQYIRQCDVFATEFDINEANNSEYMEAIVLPDGVTLQSLFKPKVYTQLENIFKAEIGQDIKEFNFLKPIAISNILAESQFKADQADSLDDTLYQFAQYEAKENIGLESFQYQLDLLKHLPLAGQVKSLKKTVTDFKKMSEHIEKTLDAYSKGDIFKIHKLVKKSQSKERKILLTKRNKTMYKRICQEAKKHSIFVAIGAAHLAGKKGILHLLQKKGCTIQAIPY